MREDGESFYAESSDYARERATPWLIENVIPFLHSEPKAWTPKSVIAKDIVAFVGASPEFWAYYADYDWVCLCQLYGCMIDLPDGWPMYCRDLKQLCDSLGNQSLDVVENAREHHALADADWCKRAWEYLEGEHAEKSLMGFAAPYGVVWHEEDL